jgi:integrase
MPKLAGKAFTDTYLRSLKPESVRRDHYDAVQRGLGLRVAPSGLKSWFVMRRVNSRMTRTTLGRYPEVPLADARKKAEAVLEQIAKGHSPKKAKVPAFAAVLDDWLTRDQKGKRSVDEKRRALAKDALPAFGNWPMDTIARSDVRNLLDSIADRGAPIYANRLLAYLRRMFNWAEERDIIASSPVAGIKAPAAERSRDRTLSPDELAAVWRGTYQMPDPFGSFSRMLILTGQRRNEVAGARWEEIDLQKGEWTIPAERAKNGKAHLVHLPPAPDILPGVPRVDGSPYVFTTTGSTPISGFSKAKAMLDKASGVTGWTIHDLRRTFATLATGELGIEPVVVDKILNHLSGAVTGIAAVYQRHAYLEQRRHAMARWGTFVAGLGNHEHEQGA